MSDNVISVENLGKLYKLGEFGTGTISHDLNRWWARMRGKEDPFAKIGVENDRAGNGSNDWVWALKDLNFQVKKGEVLGIIGRNGAGKSTLLKILSKVTSPSTGHIKIKGRIASLLEVGTGFHQELTGRENIFLNGAILGMSKAEIRSRFDDIVDFAGVSKYIDTPVKRYSSGMYVRLAFSVAAYLEPEILIVDEVLAVGDVEFQKKCIGRMKDVSRNDGRTVLFVSHNMAAVRSLCDRGIVLRKGKLSIDSTSSKAIEHYQQFQNSATSFLHDGPISEAPGNTNIRVLKFEVLPYKGEALSISTGVRFVLTFFSLRKGINLDATFELRTMDDIPVLHHGALISTNKDSKEMIYEVEGVIDPFILNAGIYKFKLIFGEDQRIPLYEVDDFIQFEIANESLGSNMKILPGLLRLDIKYNINSFDEATYYSVAQDSR